MILLGGDLEKSSRPQSGWSAVVSSSLRREKAGAFKVPHHGSKGAFCEDIWESGIEPKATAILTPYTRSGLPKADQLDKLKTMNRQLYITSLPRKVTVSRPADIERAMRMKPGGRRTIEAYTERAQFGLVRLRKRAGEDWRAELFGDARSVSE